MAHSVVFYLIMNLRVNFQNTSFLGEAKLIQALNQVPGCGIGVGCYAGDRKIIVHSIPSEKDEIVAIAPDEILNCESIPNEPMTPSKFGSTQEAAAFVRTFLQSQAA